MSIGNSLLLNCTSSKISTIPQNVMSDNRENKRNKLYKIASIIDHVRQNCIEFESLKYQFISKQIVQGKTCFTGIYEENPQKCCSFFSIWYCG